jgi:transcriptional regulator with XRE-family HTH domain
MSQQELLDLGLGQKLRRFREERGLELDELARRSGIGPEQIRAWESGQEVPAIGDLVKLTEPLEVSLGHFFQRAIPASRIEVVRASERWTLEPQTEQARSLNYKYQSLSYNLTEKLMSPFLIEIPPDDSPEAAASTHGGEEFHFVLSGEVEVTVGGEVHRLSPGDAIYFDSRLEHSLRAVGHTSARLLACIAQERRPVRENPIDRAYA